MKETRAHTKIKVTLTQVVQIFYINVARVIATREVERDDNIEFSTFLLSATVRSKDTNVLFHRISLFTGINLSEYFT